MTTSLLFKETNTFYILITGKLFSDFSQISNYLLIFNLVINEYLHHLILINDETLKIKREYVKKNTLNLKPKFFISRLYKVSPSKAFLS